VFSAYDAATGVQLWKTRLNDVPNSAPISYLVNGKQYVAMVVGNGGAQAATFPPLVPEIQNPPDRGAAIWAFWIDPEQSVIDKGEGTMGTTVGTLPTPAALGNR